MKNEESLNRYFEHGMTGAEEQNFLISVAASDELRIAFRSQLELIKAVRSDKDALHSGRDGDPVALVRGRTLAALGLSATAAQPLFDRKPIDGNHEPVVAQMDGLPMHTALQSRWIGRMLGTSTIALATGLALGVLSTLGIEQYLSNPSNSGIVSHPTAPVQAPATISSNPPAQNTPTIGETIPPGNGLVHSASHPARSIHRESEAAAHPASESVTSPSGTVPEVNRSNAGTMRSNMKINRQNDSSTGK